MTEKIEQTLAARGNSHGEWTENARVIQNIKRAMRDSPNWESLPDFMKESLEMDAVKIGRILVGDPAHADHWHDIAGYAKLSEDRCPKNAYFGFTLSVKEFTSKKKRSAKK
jgi:hypothetical protein